MARRGRIPTKKNNWEISRLVEPLETRRMLTTWVGGGMDAAGNPVDNVYTYAQPNNITMQVNIWGNTTVEGIFFNGTAIDPAATEGYLFQLYVARSDINSIISITPIDTNGIEPFATAGAALAINPDTPLIDEPTPPTATAAGETGGGVLGGLVGTGPYTPVISQNINGIQIGVRPAGLDDLPNDPNNDLSAGLVLAPGLSLGKFLFAGEVFGKVYVPGNMNLFYAGWLLTGDARGASEGSDFNSTSDGGPIELSDPSLEVPADNFYVGGDLQNLATIGPIGWDGIYGGNSATEEGPHYLSGVDIDIGGKLGAITALDGDAASVHVEDNGIVPEPTEDQQELEGLNSGEDFSGGQLIQYISGGNINPFVNNDFLHAQFLGSFQTNYGANTIAVDGTYDTGTDVDTDPDDYYGIGLMAGQTITVALNADNGARVGVFDPEGILVATNYDNQEINGADNNDPFQVTATDAGEYRIAVSAEGDIDFNDFAGSEFRLLEQTSYQLVVTNVGNLAVGGIETQGTSLETNAGSSDESDPDWRKLYVDNGDVGGIYAATNFHITGSAEVAFATLPANPQIPAPTNDGQAGIQIANGNLRSFVAGAIGLGLDTTGFSDDVYSAPDLDVPNGSVGRVQALTGILELNPNNLNETNVSQGGTVTAAPLYALAIGGDYEVVQGAPSLSENMMVGLVADGRIGEIEGPNMQDIPSIIIADADSKGDDGTIDLIDITGNLEGAYIWHGPGGDVRFIRVGGDVLDNNAFATGYGQRVVYNYNQSVTFTDDSGSTITLTPLGTSIPNPLYMQSITDLTNIASVAAFGPRLTVRTYPIASGGVVIVDVASTGGLAVNATANGVNGVAEISRIEVSGLALPPVETIDTNTGITSVALAQTPYIPESILIPGTTTTVNFSEQEITDVTISGSAKTDVGNIVVLGPSALGPLDFPVTPVNPVTALGNATDISNSTGGDIISVAALSIGDLTGAGNIGTGHTSIPGLALRFNSIFTLGNTLPGPRSEDNGNSTATTNEMPVNPIESPIDAGTAQSAGNSYPFINQTYGIAVYGDIVEILAGESVGNVIAEGIIGQVTADSGSKASAGTFAGIAGDIWGTGPTGAVLYVNIGQGVLWAGSGDQSLAGIFADNLIGNIVGSSDIHGNILSGGRILGINLTNASLDNAQVLCITVGTTSVGGVTYSDWVAARQNSPFHGGITVPQTSHFSLKPTYDIQGINISGDGGIIGTYILAYNLGNITVTGYGIIGSTISSPFDGRIATLTAGGYGLRNDTIGGGASIGEINVTGNGSELPTTAVDPDVRQSQFQPIDQYFSIAFDPFTGQELTQENDINAALGTSAITPIIVGATETGVIEDSDISDSTSLTALYAQIIRASTLGVVSDPSDPNSPANVNFPMQIDVGNNIGIFETRGVIDGLRLVSGTIKKFQPGSDVLALDMTVSGKISTLAIKGSLAGNSVINAGGTNGGIGKITIADDLIGTINVQNNVSSITIGGNLSGSLNIAGSHKGLALGKLYIKGSLLSGSLNVTGNVGTIQTAGSLGAAGSNLTFTGSLAKLLVGKGNLYANLTVGGKVGTIEVNGALAGALTVGNINGQLQSLIVNGPIDAPITVNGALKSGKINGSVNASINAVDGITKLSIINGSLAANATIETTLGSIGALIISGGDCFGSVLAPAGAIKLLEISNNLGDGVDPLHITTASLNTLSVGGSILNGVTILVTGPIGALIVGGSIEPGASISATSHRTLSVGGSIAPGSLQIG